LSGSGDRWFAAGGYAGAAILMVIAAVRKVILGVEAAGKSLEDVAHPLSRAS